MRISIVKSTLLFAIVTIIGLAAVIGTGRWALEQLRVGGPLYTKIKLGNDLVADILPPPEYVVEAYLESTLAMRDPSSLAVRRTRLAELHKDYEDRRDFWRKSDLDPGLKRKLVERPMPRFSASGRPLSATWWTPLPREMRRTPREPMSS